MKKQTEQYQVNVKSDVSQLRNKSGEEGTLTAQAVIDNCTTKISLLNADKPSGDSTDPVSDQRLQEILNGLSFWGSATGTQPDELISLLGELLSLRQQLRDAFHIGYVTNDRRMMIFKDSPNMQQDNLHLMDKLVVLKGILPACISDPENTTF